MSTVDNAQRAILQSMLRGELRPGMWLRQDELAKQMGVSKIPVREALQRLVARGLLSAERNRGIFVPTLSAEDAREVFGLRRALEPVLLRRSIPQMSETHWAEAEEALAGQGLTITESNWFFHRALYRAGEWSRGLAIDRDLHATVAPYVMLYTEELGGKNRSDQQHAELLDACRAKDAERADRVLMEHLDGAATVLEDFLASSRP